MSRRPGISIGLAIVVALVSCSSKRGTPGASSSPGATPPTSGSVPSPTASGSLVPTASGAPGAATPTAGSGGGVATPPPGSKPFVARPAGTYTFATSGQTQISGAIKRTYQLPPTTSLSVGAPADGVQRSVRDMRDSQGNGGVTEMRVRTAPDGLHLVYLKNTSTFAGVTDVREFTPNPAPLILRTGAPAGDRLTFTLEGSDVRVSTTVDVLRRESVTISGKSVQTVVIRIVSSFSGDVNGTSTAINWLRPSDGLLLQEDSRSDIQAGFTRVRTNYTAKLEKLAPS
jgi:hypothetical protein